MITACVVSPLATGGSLGAAHPKVADDYTLASWRSAAAQGTLGSFAEPANRGGVQRVVKRATSTMAVELVCDYPVFALLAADPDYRLLWYQEDGRQKRVIG